ncbi:hypothetical protein GQ44DRAFT_245468 [Phaeosphaeriaceae sp. PMI808]|nr:hypothetical protein GQ44DRAFT_245468 [Phaeosphaeriaceae sp. PMI808]
MSIETQEYPNSVSPDLYLTNPTPEESLAISKNTTALWRDSFALDASLEESIFMADAPLARNGGMTTWILVGRNHSSNQRQILSSCETFKKPTLRSSPEGEVIETIVHAIASVFCPAEHRGRGYPKRMLQDLAKKLPTWQTEEKQCIGSILYSDIGQHYYSQLGWHPIASNNHIELQPQSVRDCSLANQVRFEHLPDLCARDETLLRKRMAVPTQDTRVHVSIIPTFDHIGWHLAKEQFACNHLFGKAPEAKGAIAGFPGDQVWVLWTHRYYSQPGSGTSSNVLYILRLVMEVDETATRLSSDAGKLPDKDIYEKQIKYLKAVLQAAQNEALEWKLDTIRIWDPTPLVRHMLMEMGLEYSMVERKEESVASGMWYDERGGISEHPLYGSIMSTMRGVEPGILSDLKCHLQANCAGLWHWRIAGAHRLIWPVEFCH